MLAAKEYPSPSLLLLNHTINLFVVDSGIGSEINEVSGVETLNEEKCYLLPSLMMR